MYFNKRIESNFQSWTTFIADQNIMLYEKARKVRPQDLPTSYFLLSISMPMIREAPAAFAPSATCIVIF